MSKQEDKQSQATGEDIKKEVLENSAKDLEHLSQEVGGENASELKQQRDNFEDKYLRAAAEIQNMNAHFKKERADLLHYDGQKVITDILPVLDNLERALQAEVTDDGAQQLKKGVEMVYEHLRKTLQDANVTEIKSLGVKFDPTVHQAVQTVPADKDHPKDTVVKVLQRGYKLHERVLRPAMVVVSN
ncbi:nucleotide exchange factor GrpE [Lacticaseibacillus zhaodongensis]|uniref:nucleotide exchange factor GrpE n=1 Tax=Lacticaseibacillus zhaodongensis TaxID=2668065 RepID=UPI0012D314A2|nr:nucleotide exchange factor GrpE [Lacticaseibacillus zhaodongensis]